MFQFYSSFDTLYTPKYRITPTTYGLGGYLHYIFAFMVSQAVLTQLNSVFAGLYIGKIYAKIRSGKGGLNENFVFVKHTFPLSSKFF